MPSLMRTFPAPTAEHARRAAPDSPREAGLHALDYEDLTLSEQGLRLVRRAATGMLRRFSCAEAAKLSPAKALALFLDRVFWDEQTGGLLLCADFPGGSFCLPIPRGLWGLRRREGYAQ